MGSEIVGPVVLVGFVVSASMGGLLWVAAQDPGLPAGALVGVDDQVHDRDGDGVVDGHVVVVERVSSSVEGARVEFVVGSDGFRTPARAVEGAGLFVPCSFWRGPVEVVLWTSRVSGVFHRQVAGEVVLSGCPGESVVDASERSPEVDTSGDGEPDGWMPPCSMKVGFSVGGSSVEQCVDVLEGVVPANRSLSQR